MGRIIAALGNPCGSRPARQGTKPLFSFGYGLSYTTFAYKDLSITPAGGGRFDVSLSVTNTGARSGADVVQVYVRVTHAKVQWRADPGEFEILVGRSTDQIELKGTLTVWK